MLKLRIPATSANIGPGFDSIGLAVGLYNYVTLEEYDGLAIESLDGKEIPTDETNLVYTTAKRLYELCGVPFRGLKIGQINNIPLTRGLGSSSACVIAGLKGANRLMGNPVSDDELLNLAAGIEGHPDNSTPALTGGLVTAVFDGKKVWYVKQEIKNDLRFVAVVSSCRPRRRAASCPTRCPAGTGSSTSPAPRSCPSPSTAETTITCASRRTTACTSPTAWGS